MGHINYPLVAKAHTSMYVMHKFWARKPHNVVRAYVEHYSKKGDIVLDPFCGSGPTPIEALKSERKAIAIDLDPIATFITRMCAIPIDLKKFEDAFNKIKENAKDKIEQMYKTECEKCQRTADIICTHWKNTTPIKIMYECPDCGKRSKVPAQEDIHTINNIKKKLIPYWYPKTKLWYNSTPFMKKEKRDYLHELFAKRNLIALSIVYHEIESLDEGIVKELMRFTFTSMVHLASILTPVRPTRQYSSFWPVHSYWVPPVFMESNVWLLFESAFKGRQGVLRGKAEANEEIKRYKETKSFDDFKKDANIMIRTHNALELDEIIPPNSVDYVFTDPPYGGAIQYFELSTLWTSWLKGKEGNKEFDLNFKDEITINESQKKDFDYYHKMLKTAFDQIFRVLRTGGYLTVTFHSTDIKVWNSIIKAVALAGFELEKIVYQPPARASAKGLLQPYGSAIGDYYIRFRKPKRKKLPTATEIDEERYERIVVESAKRIIAERGEPTMYQHILNGIMVELEKEGALLLGKKNIEDVMKAQVDKEFILEPVRKNGKVVGHKWWFKDPAAIRGLTRVPLNERVERVVIDELTRKIKVSFDDILQYIFIKFPNALTPETQSVRDILKEYASMKEFYVST